MRILAIETSCDETAVAIIETSGVKTHPRVLVLSNIVSSQIALHAKFGGVVPNLARREHENNLPLIIAQSIREAGDWNYKLQMTNDKRVPNYEIQKIEKILEREPDLFSGCEKHIFPLPVPDIDAIAVTNGPGLAPALWVGVNCARALACLWHRPLIPVNHMEGHIVSALLQQSGNNDKLQMINDKKIRGAEYGIQKIYFPALALLVSGGHTELVLVKKFGSYQIIGETRDDAVGEAFDKVARILGLPYPGGPALAALAERGDADAFSLPRPMIGSKNYDFSYSGLKTAVLYLVRDMKKSVVKKRTADIAASFQKAAIEVLIKKTIRAIKEYKIKTIIVGGGVAANQLLRTRLTDEVRKLPSVKLFLPDPSITGDNALMIALAAYLSGKKKTPTEVGVVANMRLSV